MALLLQNGYVELPSRVAVGEIELEVPGLWEGPPDSLDLSLVADRPTSREAALRLYWLVQRLTHALDAATSRRTVTVILVGYQSSPQAMNELLEFARVLIVDGSLPSERMLGPILRLRLPSTATSQLDGIAEVAEAMSNKPAARELQRLIEGASAGATVVSDRYRAWIEESFSSHRSADA
ncbi:hypothetical protein SCMU_38860 [Sinomonas cyclohexanicum]|uniref:Uncharacterized protein n=1 Tax=Sinomonas cyclohexanicum TaxID=322009 RepID=A0ABN6FMH0_SINCY|nr:hypothetical protein [Corynebacterium cyclohexanicum]BCT78044.1 hypothetical protein SCMU_38860 [Corynebacterium cyclohexanicum]